MFKKMSAEEVEAHNQRSPLVRGVMWFVSVMFIVMGPLIGAIMIPRTLGEMRAFDDWPVVEGRILESEMTTTVGRRARSTEKWEFVCAYDADGTTYRTRNYSGPLWTPKEPLATYPQGSTTDVRYNPDDPAEGLIGPGPSWLNIAIFGAVVIVGPVIGVSGVHKLRKSGREMDEPPPPSAPPGDERVMTTVRT